MEMRMQGGYELFLCQPVILETVNSGLILISGTWGFWKLCYSSGQAAKSFASSGKGTEIYKVPTLS